MVHACNRTDKLFPFSEDLLLFTDLDGMHLSFFSLAEREDHAWHGCSSFFIGQVPCNPGKQLFGE